MRVGMNLLLWTTFVQEQHFPVLGELREAGFDGVEVPVGEGDAAHYRRLAAELDRIGLARTAVVALDAATNPASPDPAVRAAALAGLRRAIEVGAELGAEVLCGPFHSAYKVFTGQPPTADELRHGAEVLHDAAGIAARAGLRLAIEPLNRFECYLVNTDGQGRALVEAADHPALGVLHDTHHAHIEEKDAGAALEGLGGHCFHVHVSESDRGTPGSGQVDWDGTFAALQRMGYGGWLVIESFSRADPEFAAAVNIWREFDPPEEVWREGLRFVRGRT